MKPACLLMSVVALPLGWVGCDSDRGTGVVKTSSSSTAVATSEGCDSDRGAGVVETGFPCPVTDAIWAEPPRDPHADPFGMGPWYINADRTIWAGFDAVRMVACPDDNKVGWIRPQGTQLTVSGRRLDADGLQHPAAERLREDEHDQAPQRDDELAADVPAHRARARLDARTEREAAEREPTEERSDDREHRRGLVPQPQRALLRPHDLVAHRSEPGCRHEEVRRPAPRMRSRAAQPVNLTT